MRGLLACPPAMAPSTAADLPPPDAPSPARSAATRGHPPPFPLPGLGAARQFPPREPSLFPSAGARRALCLPAGRACAAAAILRCLSPALPFGELSPPPCSPAQRPPPVLREETGPGGGETRGGGDAGRDREGRKDGRTDGRGRGARGRRTDPRRGSAEEERVPPVIKGEEAEGEGRACGAEPPPETARHRGRRERLPGWLPLPPSLLFMDSLVGLPLLFFPPYSVSSIPKMIQLHGCH